MDSASTSWAVRVPALLRVIEPPRLRSVSAVTLASTTAVPPAGRVPVAARLMAPALLVAERRAAEKAKATLASLRLVLLPAIVPRAVRLS